jgi:hypothetical protein
MPWPKGKPRSLETRTKMSKGGVLLEQRAVCACGQPKNPHRSQCRNCWVTSPALRLLGERLGSRSKGQTKTQEHRIKLAESQVGKHEHGGENNPNWRGGVSTLSHSIRTSDRYREWQKQVIQASNSLCHRCETSVWRLPKKGYACHHVIQFKDLISAALQAFPDEVPVTACMRYEPLWAVDNGWLMHKNCHIQHHIELRFGALNVRSA